MTKSSKLGLAFGAVVMFLIACTTVGERWTSPAEELRIALAYNNELAQMERVHLSAYGSYGNLEELFRTASGRFRVRSRCQEGYCFQVDATPGSYAIKILPELAPGKSHQYDRAVSLYSDQTQVVRFQYGLPRADQRSPALSEQELRKFSW